jgi:hypothetical protein
VCVCVCVRARARSRGGGRVFVRMRKSSGSIKWGLVGNETRLTSQKKSRLAETQLVPKKEQPEDRHSEHNVAQGALTELLSCTRVL